MTSQRRTASRAARMGAGVVASGAAALSFRGTADYAEKSHAVDPGWGWIVPLVVEAGVLTAAAIAWVRSGDGVTARVETTVMASLLTLSVVINVAHAATTTLLGHVVAATPPLVLLVAVEGLLREQRRVARLKTPLAVADWSADVSSADERPIPSSQPDGAQNTGGRQAGNAEYVSTIQTPATARQVVTVPPSPNDASADVVPLQVDRPLDLSPPSAPAASSVPSLLLEVFRALDAGEAVTGASVGAWLDVSESTGLRRLRELRIRHPELDLKMRASRQDKADAETPSSRDRVPVGR
ncbi:hypothetical protein ABIB25_005729 [Nakamurella sp. UYEF19]|uniref:DUF2637 domain-containing protein n=1 Tax=Nakamurella sp. UYEF19 TaxID=1756392 RepID=UPI003394627F